MTVETEVEIDEKIKKEVTKPPMYKVIFLNDNETPIEFVIGLLESVFHHSIETAKQITLTVHTEGSAVVGCYNFEVAEQKSFEAITMSRNHGFPLQIKLEQE
jgi:ATP-dependent Clp protease adaptor protein ClpS